MTWQQIIDQLDGAEVKPQRRGISGTHAERWRHWQASPNYGRARGHNGEQCADTDGGISGSDVMPKPILNSHLIGRFGNQLFQWAYAKAFAEKNSLDLRTNAWIGQQVFDGVSSAPMVEGAERLPDNYRQSQADIIYTRNQVREWFRWKPEIEKELRGLRTSNPDGALAHRRAGDYRTTPGYPVISCQSYLRHSPVTFITEEDPFKHPSFTGDLACIPDFYVMTKARRLLRANSTFSWWAACLNPNEVFAPIIDGLPGFVDTAQECDVEFVPGNWPKCADLPGITDLHLPET